MNKGKNGQQLAKEYAEQVEAWVVERNKRRDWNEYVFNNRTNRRMLAKELNFSDSVCTQNPEVRKILETADKLWFQVGRVDRKTSNVVVNSKISTSNISATNNNFANHIARLEVENRELNQELKAYKVQQELIEGGAPGFKL
jgi:hypothetical protein